MTLLPYADNIWVIGRTVTETRIAVNRIVGGMKQMGWTLGGDGELLINPHITQRPPPGIKDVTWNGEELKIVEGMKVLGFRLNPAGTDTDIRKEMFRKSWAQFWKTRKTICGGKHVGVQIWPG